MLGRKDPQSEAQFLLKIKQEVKVISNINFILEKIERDGFLGSLRETLERVLSNEISFAVGKLHSLGRTDHSIDLKNQLINNTYIFKENLKLICNFISDLSSRAALEGAYAVGCAFANGVGGSAATENWFL